MADPCNGWCLHAVSVGFPKLALNDVNCLILAIAELVIETDLSQAYVLYLFMIKA